MIRIESYISQLIDTALKQEQKLCSNFGKSYLIGLTLLGRDIFPITLPLSLVSNEKIITQKWNIYLELWSNEWTLLLEILQDKQHRTCKLQQKYCIDSERIKSWNSYSLFHYESSFIIILVYLNWTCMLRDNYHLLNLVQTNYKSFLLIYYFPNSNEKFFILCMTKLQSI